MMSGLNPSLIQKGLRRCESGPPNHGRRLNPSLIQKGLRPAVLRSMPVSFPGLNPSLIQKGLRRLLCPLGLIHALRLNPSLIQKGLRHRRHRDIFSRFAFESFPDSEGIKTMLAACWRTIGSLNPSLIQKGLRQLAGGICPALGSLNPSLIQKGLRHRAMSCPI